MRRGSIAALMMTLVLLSGCGRNVDEAAYEQFRTLLDGAEEITITSLVCADSGDTVREYTLRAVCARGESSVEVLEPELVAGVRAHLEEDGSRLEFDGLILDTGGDIADGLSPVSALARLAEAMKTGYAETFWREDGCLAVKLVPDDETEVTVWFDESGSAPVRAEFTERSGGRRLVLCEISDFSIL